MKVEMEQRKVELGTSDPRDANTSVQPTSPALPPSFCVLSPYLCFKMQLYTRASAKAP
eukprot:m.169394 g.169394  ORF g.169394 m.169394 type:complete len:58 (-) comp14494_c0_seq8:445-618(-)